MIEKADHSMVLGELLRDEAAEVAAGSPNAVVSDVRDDSRQIVPGALFVARRGTADDGSKYIDDAMSRGAAAAVRCDALTMGRLAERFWGEPSQKLKLIGITGTNGKTTVAYMVRHLLNATGRKCGMMTTVEVDDGDTSGGAEPRAAELTTPGSCEISRTLARMVANGCAAAVMECSSHALDQGRCDALDFDVAVFTNLSGDHLDYHETMEQYAAAKAKLFELLAPNGYAIVNGDDPWSARMTDGLGISCFAFGIGEAREGVLWNAQILEATADGTQTILDGFDDRPFKMRLPLIGLHNVANLLAAVGAVNLSGVGFSALMPAIKNLPAAPGRLERVTNADSPFTVLVDYAHTDDALRNVLESLRPLVPTGAALRVLFGCGGDRDKTKRPRMAAAACGLADHVVITSDNPRTEDPQAIIADIEAGVPGACRDRVTTIVDRRDAIEHIIRTAEPDDIVLIAGKGHEDYQIIGKTKHPFDDRQVARAILQSR